MTKINTYKYTHTHTHTHTHIVSRCFKMFIVLMIVFCLELIMKIAFMSY